MAFDKNLPADASKLRLSAGYIRNNWDAIVTGDITFTPAVINLTKQGAAPAILANNYRLYSQVAGANVELFGKNTAGNAVQLTKGLPTPGAQGHSFLPGGFIISWGNNAYADNATITAAGMTTLYQVVITIDDAAVGASQVAYVHNITGATFQVRLPGGSTNLHWIAIGV